MGGLSHHYNLCTLFLHFRSMQPLRPLWCLDPCARCTTLSSPSWNTLRATKATLKPCASDHCSVCLSSMRNSSFLKMRESLTSQQLMCLRWANFFFFFTSVKTKTQKVWVCNLTSALHAGCGRNLNVCVKTWHGYELKWRFVTPDSILSQLLPKSCTKIMSTFRILKTHTGSSLLEFFHCAKHWTDPFIVPWIVKTKSAGKGKMGAVQHRICVHFGQKQ